MNGGFGSLAFRMVNMRADVGFVFFRDGKLKDTWFNYTYISIGAYWKYLGRCMVKKFPVTREQETIVKLQIQYSDVCSKKTLYTIPEEIVT
jgi:hypothetical protein